MDAPSKVLKGPRACATCARAKSRCIAGPPGQGKCERCHRLRKPCSSQTPAPPRKRKGPKPTRVAELERRLEDLTARIESVHRLEPTLPTPPGSDHHSVLSRPPDAVHVDSGPPKTLSGRVAIPTFGRDRWDSPFGHIFPDESIFDVQPAPPSSGLATASNDRTMQAAESAAAPAPPEPTPAQTATTGLQSPSPSQQPSPQVSQEHEAPPWPEGEESQELLDQYRTHLGRLFPFVVVPTHVSSAQLQEEKPLFWKGIMMASCLFDGVRQIALGTALLKDISEAALVKPQKNIGLLQGLQMLIAWYHYNLNSFQMANVLFLARSITTSLGCAELKNVPEDGRYASEDIERMRAFAATYYLVTLTFTTNKRPDALMNTSYLAACCQALHKRMEYPTDELVVHLVRAQQLSQSILQAFARRKAAPQANQPPQASFIQILLERVRTFDATLPPHIKANVSLSGHLHVAEIIIYENTLPELAHYPNPASSSSAPPPPEEADRADAERIERLFACACVVRAFMAKRFAVERSEFPRFICLTSFDLTYVFFNMIKLVTLHAPGWDLVRAREEIGFGDFMNQLIEDMEETAGKKRRKMRKPGETMAGRSQTAGSTAPDQADDGAEGPWRGAAGKIRILRDHLLDNVFDSEYTSSQVARVLDPVPMTLVDATQDLMQDFVGGLWDDVTGGVHEWTPFFMGDTFDWPIVVFNSYDSVS